MPLALGPLLLAPPWVTPPTGCQRQGLGDPEDSRLCLQPWELGSGDPWLFPQCSPMRPALGPSGALSPPHRRPCRVRGTRSRLLDPSWEDGWPPPTTGWEEVLLMAMQGRRPSGSAGKELDTWGLSGGRQRGPACGCPGDPGSWAGAWRRMEQVGGYRGSDGASVWLRRGGSAAARQWGCREGLRPPPHPCPFPLWAPHPCRAHINTPPQHQLPQTLPPLEGAQGGLPTSSGSRRASVPSPPTACFRCGWLGRHGGAQARWAGRTRTLFPAPVPPWPQGRLQARCSHPGRCACVHTRTHALTHTHACTHGHTHARTDRGMPTHTPSCVHICTHVHSHTHTHIQHSCAHVCTHSHTAHKQQPGRQSAAVSRGPGLSVQAPDTLGWAGRLSGGALAPGVPRGAGLW